MDFSRPLQLWVTNYLFVAFTASTAAIQRNENSRSMFVKEYPGHTLHNHVIAQYHVTCELTCGMKCLANSACLSFNYEPISNQHRSNGNCQINNANRITSPESYLTESGVIYFEVIQAESGKETADAAPVSFDLTFEAKNPTSYVSLTWPASPESPVRKFTLCFWMKTADLDNGVLFSYSVSSAVNEVAVKKGLFYINDDSEQTYLGDYYDGIWHHVCVLWKNGDGNWRVFVDGAIIDSGNSFQTGHVITTGGMLLVGQGQDQGPGDQSFVGSISGMNVWNKVFHQQEILRMSKTCEAQVGNVLQWSEFQVSLHGDVIVESPSSCKVP